MHWETRGANAWSLSSRRCWYQCSVSVFCLKLPHNLWKLCICKFAKYDIHSTVTLLQLIQILPSFLPLSNKDLLVSSLNSSKQRIAIPECLLYTIWVAILNFHILLFVMRLSCRNAGQSRRSRTYIVPGAHWARNACEGACNSVDGKILTWRFVINLVGGIHRRTNKKATCILPTCNVAHIVNTSYVLTFEC